MGYDRNAAYTGHMTTNSLFINKMLIKYIRHCCKFKCFSFFPFIINVHRVCYCTACMSYI
jgi:hypothetical protein